MFGQRKTEPWKDESSFGEKDQRECGSGRRRKSASGTVQRSGVLPVFIFENWFDAQKVSKK
jgi:hypothetical protein